MMRALERAVRAPGVASGGGEAKARRNEEDG
jgi:hypothetical protein